MKIQGISQKPQFVLNLDGANQFQRQLLPGNVSGLFVYFSGTNASGQAVAASDFTLQVEHEGRMIANVKGDVLQEIANQIGGYIQNASATGAAFSIAAFLPFSHGDVENTLRVRPGGNTTVTWIPGSGYGTKVSAGTVEVYQIEGDAPQNYIPHLLPYNLAAFSGTYRENLPFQNVKELYIYGANLTQITVERDDRVKFNGNAAPMTALTSFLSALEAAAATYIHVNFGERPTDYLSKVTNIQLNNSSSAAVTIQVVSFEFDDNQYNQSVAQLASETKSRIDRVPASGKALPILLQAKSRQNAV